MDEIGLEKEAEIKMEKEPKNVFKIKLTKRIQILVQNNKLERALSILKEVFKYESLEEMDCQNEVIMVFSQLNKINSNSIAGVDSFENIEEGRNKIREKILTLMAKVPDAFAAKYIAENSIFQRIVLVCRDENRLDDLDNLFSEEIYVGAEKAIHESDFNTKELPRREDLIVYDDFPKHDESGEIPPRLVEIIDKTESRQTPILVFCPERIPDLQEHYSDRTYMSNSKFSIHARIQDMLLYFQHQPIHQKDSK